MRRLLCLEPIVTSHLSRETELSADSAAGFVVHRRVFDEPYQVVKLLVPINVKERLDFEAARLEAERLEEAAKEQESAARERAQVIPKPELASQRKKEWWLGDPVLGDAFRMHGALAVPEPSVGPKQRRIFSLSDVANRLDSLQPGAPGARTGDNVDRDRAIFLQLKTKGSVRDLTSPSSWADELDWAETSQPHFKAVLDFLRGRFAQAEASGRSVFIPPILLVGAPGVGKTHFAMELATVLKVSVRRHAMDSADTAAALMGSHKSWGNTTVGFLFEEVCLGEQANPIVILDELDKVTAAKYGNPIGPLHTLLEQVTASKVRDLSLDFEFDASQVTWIATANVLADVPAALRSRFEIFEIPMPTAEQARAIARHLADAVVKNACAGHQPPDDEIINALTHLTAREMKKALQSALGRAALERRQALRLTDLPEAVRKRNKTARAPMGFGTDHPSVQAMAVNAEEASTRPASRQSLSRGTSTKPRRTAKSRNAPSAARTKRLAPSMVPKLFRSGRLGSAGEGAR